MKKYIIGFIVFGILIAPSLLQAQGVRLPRDTKQRLKSELRTEVTAEIGDTAALKLDKDAVTDTFQLFDSYNGVSTDSLVSLFTFDFDARDDWGNSDATVTGASLITQSDSFMVGRGAYTFSGGTDQVAITGIGKYATYTVSAWINTNHNANAGIFSRGGSGAGDRWNFYVGSSGVLEIYSNMDAGAVSTTGTTALNNGKWHFVAAVNDGTDQIVYVNGIEEGRDGISEDWRDLSSIAATIGRLEIDAYSMAGLIDNVRIDKRALSAAEIGRLYALGAVDKFKDVIVRGNLTVEGNFIETTNAHVELSTTDSATTSVTGGTFRGLSNTFETTRIAEFTAQTDTLVYTGADSILLGWNFGVSATSGDANNTVKFQVFINSVSVGNSGFMVRDFKTANAEGFLGGNGIVALGNSDSLWILITDITTATWGIEAFHLTLFEIDKFE